MNKILKVFLNIIQFFCFVIILWFLTYFFWGERFSITLKERVFAEYLPQILTFGAAVSVYLLFILSIHSKRKKWKNILLFLGGLILAALPLLAFHLYFQYQCAFWNQEIKSSKTIYFNQSHPLESIKAIQTECQNEIRIDTVHSQEFMRYFELQNPVKIEKADSGNWALKKQVQ